MFPYKKDLPVGNGSVSYIQIPSISISSSPIRYLPTFPFRLTPSLDTKMPSDEQAITTLLTAYGTSLKTCKVDEAVSLYTSDGVIMAPGYAPSCGTEALQKSYTRIFSTIRLEINFTIDEIVLTSDEWAFARSTAAGTKYWVKAGTSETHSNQELFVLRKVEGEWKIARYSFSSMKPIV